ELVGTAYPQQLNTWEPFEIPLNNYHGNGQYIALMSPNGVNSYPYLDELNVEYISACPRVRNVTTSRIGLHSALVSWDTTAASSYEVEYGPAGFAFGTGTRITGITDDTLTLTGLASSSHYDVYVRGLCSPDTSNWSFAHTFNTQCGMIDSLPFFENFNNIGTGTSIHSPQCWYGTSTYSSSYPYPSTSYSRSGGGAAMYMYLSNTSGYYTMLQLPPVDTTELPINTLQIEFSLLRSTTSYVHGVVLGVCTGQGMQDFTPIDTFVVTASTGQWQDYEVFLNNYSGYGNYITFLAYAGTETTCYPYLDDIRVSRLPSCVRPDSLYATNATSSTVQLGWRERGTATAWEIEYGPTGYTVGTGTRVVTTSNPTTLVGLPASYQGDFYVRSICSATDTSIFSGQVGQFSTSQMPATIPYYCNFEDSTEWAAWQTSSNTYINWARGTAEVDSGTYSMYVSPDGGLTYGNENFSSVVNAAVFRDVDFGTVDTSFTLTYRAKVGGTIAARYDGLMVFVVDQSIPAVPSSSGITSPWGNVNDLYRVSLAYLDTNWDTYVASIDTIHGVHRVAFFWFNQNTGASYDYLPGPAAVDNIRIVVSPCARPVNLDTVSVTNTTATLHWDGSASENYRVAYRVAGAPASTNVYVNASTNHVTLTGLDPMTTYRAWVQKLCGSDSSLFSDGVEFQTEMCADAFAVLGYNPSWSTTTSSYAPIGYSFYNYSYVQTLIDSAQMAGMTEPITAMEFNPVNGNQGNYYTNMDIYLANVSESDLSSGFIMPDANHQFVQMTNSADLTYTDGGWHVVGFDTTFTWDGHSNVLVAVNRRHGSYQSGASFNAHVTTGVKTRYVYQDSGPYNPATVSGGTTANYVGDLRLVSCGSTPVCHEPIITGISHTYEDATITWSGDGTAYDVNVKESTATNWPATDIHVTGNTYTFTGLQPSTSYTFRVRQDCTADTLGYSDWVIDGFTTDSLPCVAPDSLHVTAVTNATATLDWSPRGYETMWEIHVWTSGGLDSVYTAISHPATVGGFTANTTYNASIRALCGSLGNVLGDWGDTITFTTAVCPDVTGLGTRGVTANSVEVYWDPDPMAQTWIIEYGFHGFDLGTGTQVTTSLTTYTINGLLDDMEYDFRVRAVCGDNWQSEGWATTSATTLVGGVPCDPPTAVSAVVAGNAATVSWTANTGN
ncbi:MAG: fibronectin type III domain-containing protein, partial [Muribaculaceae bacterium]|nr:fibronectin type III domain-containing protein [Muribaculaceae bacterium]